MKNLNEQKAEHIIVGGFCMREYDTSRKPDDIDIWVNPKGDNPERVKNALLQAGFSPSDVSWHAENWADKDGGVSHIYHTETGIRLDVLPDVSGSELMGGFDGAYNAANPIFVSEHESRILDFQHLTVNKIASEREKDRADAQTLLDLNREMTRHQDSEVETFQTKFRALCDKVAEKERGPEPERAEKSQQTTSKPEKQQVSKPTQEQDRDWGHEW